MSGLLFVALSLALGLVGLFPVRRALTPLGYTTAALPTGLLGWAMTAAVANVAGTPLSATMALLGGIASALVIALASRWLTRAGGESTGAFDWRPVALWSGVLLALSGIVAANGATALSWDSSFSYVPWGVWLEDTGAFADVMMSSRSVLIPAMIAVERSLGGDWPSVIFVALGVNTLALLALGISWTDAASYRGRWVGALAAVSLLAYATPFAFHALYVHGHMVSAAFLLLGLVATEQARTHETDAWLLVAGLATAGLAVARPDGIAYAIVLVAAAVFTALSRDDGHSALIAFTSGFLVPTWLVAGSALATLGLWEGDKLTGSILVGLLVAYTVALGAYVALAGTRRREGWARAGRWFLIGGVGAALAATWILAPEETLLAYRNTVANLVTHEGGFGAGGYAAFWPFAFGLAVLVLAAPRLRHDSALVRLLAWIAMYVAIALVIHAVTHPGRIGWNDSLTRVAFHIVPVVMWLYGSVIARVVPGGRGAEVSAIREIEQSS